VLPLQDVEHPISATRRSSFAFLTVWLEPPRSATSAAIATLAAAAFTLPAAVFYEDWNPGTQTYANQTKLCNEWKKIPGESCMTIVR
jgi:hypothetical protein